MAIFMDSITIINQGTTAPNSLNFNNQQFGTEGQLSRQSVNRGATEIITKEYALEDSHLNYWSFTECKMYLLLAMNS
jgi:hypothetical protein